MELGAVIPILRMYDLPATRRFHLDRLGCTRDWQDGGPEGPVSLRGRAAR